MEPWPEIREGRMERKNWSIVRIQQVMIAPYFSLLNIPCGYDKSIINQWNDKMEKRYNLNGNGFSLI